MADSKISDLTDGGGVQAGDLVAVARAGASYKAKPVGSDGWIDDTAETWTYASGSGGGTATFTVPGDKRAKYTVGTRIKLTQTTVKYFVVSADPTYDGTNTTVTITAGSDYTLANAAISANYHSYAANPQGYPGWFNFAPAAAGFSSKTQDNGRFTLIGRTMHVWTFIVGTSNSTGFTFTLPIPAAQSQSFETLTADGGTVGAGRCDSTANSTTATLRKTVTGTGFAGSGTKATGDTLRGVMTLITEV